MGNLTKLKTIGGTTLYQDDQNAVLWKSSFAVNADGSPHAYAPDQSGLNAVDFLANAGSPGNWWGIACDSSGQPYRQSPWHSAPGFYVSTTALVDPNYPEDHPDRYLDSERYGFYVIPGGEDFCKLGDVGLALNVKTDDNYYFAVGDIGPKDQIGEGSMLLARCLGLSPNPKTGGTSEKIIACVVFPNSDSKYQDWEPKCKLAIRLVYDWGGLARLKELSAEM